MNPFPGLIVTFGSPTGIDGRMVNLQFTGVRDQGSNLAKVPSPKNPNSVVTGGDLEFCIDISGSLAVE